MAADEAGFRSAAPPGPPSRFAFSSEAIPERERVPFLRDELASLISLDVDLLGERPPQHRMSFVEAGPVALSAIHVTPTAFTRTRAHFDRPEDFFFNPMTAGWQILTYRGEPVRYEPGEGCLLPLGGTARCDFPEGGSAIGIRIEGAALRALVRRPEDALGRPVRRDAPGMALLLGYLRSFAEARDRMTPDLLQSFGRHVVDLVASIVGATSDGAAEAEAGGVRAARLRRVLDRIAANACDAGFTVETVAAELSVTSRTVQMMLEETGSTFSEHVAEHRLRHAWRALAEPRSRLSIAEVAYESGFNDLSHFYRAFRRRFGETPAAVRGRRSSAH